MKKQLKTLFIFGLALVFLSGLVYSQSRATGAIEGRIFDSERNPLPGAEVKLSSPKMMGGSRSTITDASGRFRFIALPAGAYVIEASLEGFVPAKRDGAKLHVGDTLTVDIELKIGTLTEEVTVTAVAPLIDVKDSAVGVNIVDEEFLQSLPDRRREARYMISFSPGVIGVSAFGGSSRDANATLLDGMDITEPRWGGDWSTVDYNIFEELQIKGLGAGAEYDSFGGAINNMITKSGGNAFAGNIDLNYADWSWESHSHIDVTKPMFELWEAPPKRLELDYGFTLGGPVLKDRLWFFTAARYRNMKRELEGMSEKYSLELPKFFLKFSSQLSSSDRMTALFSYDNYFNKRTNLSIFRPPETCEEEWGPTYLINFSEFHTFSSYTFLELKAAAALMPSEYRPAGGVDLAGRVDARTGMHSVNMEEWAKMKGNRYSFYATLSHHANDFIVGSHDFKFGVEYENSPAHQEGGYSGGYFYRDYVMGDDDNYHFYAYSYSYNEDNTFKRISGFIQDNWKVSDNLTINPGIRYNYYTGWIKSLGETVFKSSTITPRLGFTWDILGDHSTALKAHVGRYSASMKHNYYRRAGLGMNDWIMYEVMPDGTKVEIDREAYTSAPTLNPDIKFPVMDQITIGIERALLKDFRFGVTFIWRKWDNFMFRVNTGASWEKVPYTFEDENGIEQTIDVYNQTSLAEADEFYITNPEAGQHNVIETPRATYRGFMFTLTKRFSNNWLLNASYVYCVLRGTRQGGDSGTSTYLNPNSQISSYGPLGNDPTHQLKIFSTHILPFGIKFSPGLTYHTGSPWTRQVRASGIIGNPTVNIEPRGSNRYKHNLNVDIRIEKFFTIGGGQLGILADLMNAINYGRETRVETRVDRGTFGLATRLNSGRLIRLGIRYRF